MRVLEAATLAEAVVHAGMGAGDEDGAGGAGGADGSGGGRGEGRGGRERSRR
ncbi:hypothetical protein GCM10027586_08970 [Kineococcus gypseus]